jgi:hypothetical protein
MFVSIDRARADLRIFNISYRPSAFGLYHFDISDSSCRLLSHKKFVSQPRKW